MNQTVIHLHSSALAAEVAYSFPQDLFTEQTTIIYSATANGQIYSASSLNGLLDGLLAVCGGQADTEVVCSVTITGQFADANGMAKVTCPGLEDLPTLTYADLSGGTWSVSGTAMTLEALAANNGFKTQDAWDFAMVMEFEVGDNAELTLNTSGSSTDVYVDWGDGSEVTHHTGTTQPSHEYRPGGTYDVRIVGTVTGFRTPDETFRRAMRKVKSWGQLDGLTNMAYGFQGCSGLTEIVSDTDGAFEDVTDFTNCFSECRSLTFIPEGLFDNCPGVTTFNGCFYYCSGLMFIPDDLFDNCTGVTGFSTCFSYCSGLTSIPDGLFDNCPDVTRFGSCFSGCEYLTSIPDGLFDNCPKVTAFAGCFNGCRKLTSIPDRLFDNCPNVTDFRECFKGCTNLSGSTPKDPDGGELWERAGKEGYPSSVNGTNCFNGCTGLSNYSEIPIVWR